MKDDCLSFMYFHPQGGIIIAVCFTFEYIKSHLKETWVSSCLACGFMRIASLYSEDSSVNNAN